MQDSTTHSFRPPPIFRGEKKKHPGNNFCTDSHSLMKTEQHRWYCNTSTFNARSMSNGQITTPEGKE